VAVIQSLEGKKPLVQQEMRDHPVHPLMRASRTVAKMNPFINELLHTLGQASFLQQRLQVLMDN